MKKLLVFVFLLSTLACDKDDDNNNNPPDDGIKQEDKDKAAALQTFLQANGFQISKYYSETPIDYVDTDQVVKAETDLWQYVSPWLKDDRYTFGADGQVTIQQNTVTLPSDATPTLTRPYAVAADQNGVAFDFLTNEYQPLEYRLITFNDTLLKVNATWNGHTVVTEYVPSP